MRDLGHDRERAPGAGERAAEIVAGDVLHHPAARPDRLAAAIDRLHAEHMIARRAREDAPAAGEIGGDHAADGGLRRAEAEHGPKVDRLEGELLVVLGEHLLDLGERRAGQAPPAPARSARKAARRPGSRCSAPRRAAPGGRSRAWCRAPSPQAACAYRPPRRPDRPAPPPYREHGSRRAYDRSLGVRSLPAETPCRD